MATESLHHRFVRWKVEDLLAKYPGLRLSPSDDGCVTITGSLAFVVEAPGKERIADEYQIRLSVPEEFPLRIASVREVGGRISRSFHKLDDGSLCLGAPTRVRLVVAESPSILRFVDRCVIPYLYGYSYFEKHGILPFGELKHGEEGIREDLALLFGTDRKASIQEFVRLTAMRKRHANKAPCPCGSGRRLGRCHHGLVNRLRDVLGRPWFRLMGYVLREHGVRTSAKERSAA
jgi:hypothetical protein